MDFLHTMYLIIFPHVFPSPPPPSLALPSLTPQSLENSCHLPIITTQITEQDDSLQQRANFFFLLSFFFLSSLDSFFFLNTSQIFCADAKEQLNKVSQRMEELKANFCETARFFGEDEHEDFVATLVDFCVMLEVCLHSSSLHFTSSQYSYKNI